MSVTAPGVDARFSPDASERERLTEAGRLRASELGWDRMAAAVDGAIESELGRG